MGMRTPMLCLLLWACAEPGPEAEAPISCDSCELDEERCDADRVTLCAASASDDACRHWVVIERCDPFEVCESPARGCQERSVEPTAFDVPVPEIGSGVHVHALHWDGASGLAVFQTLRGDQPILGLARFDRQGVSGTPLILGFVGREPRLVDTGGVKMVWVDGAGRVQLGKVGSGGVGELGDVTRGGLGGNLFAMPLEGAMALLQQDTERVYLDRVREGEGPRAYDVTPRKGWYRPTAIAVPGGGEAGDELVVWVDAARDALNVTRFAADGTRRAERTFEVDSPFELPAVLGVVPGRDGGHLVVWSAVESDRFEVFVGELGPDLELGDVHATGDADLDFGISAALIGHDQDHLWVGFRSRDGVALRLAKLDRDARLIAARTLVSTAGGAVVVAGAELVYCWGVDYEGLRCAIEPKPQ